MIGHVYHGISAIREAHEAGSTISLKMLEAWNEDWKQSENPT